MKYWLIKPFACKAKDLVEEVQKRTKGGDALILEIIKQLEKCGQKLLDIKDVIAIRMNNRDFEIQVYGIEIIKTLAIANESKVCIESRDCDDYPWEVFVKLGKFKVFTILEHEELIKYAKENCPSDVGASAEAGSEITLSKL